VEGVGHGEGVGHVEEVVHVEGVVQRVRSSDGCFGQWPGHGNGRGMGKGWGSGLGALMVALGNGRGMGVGQGLGALRVTLRNGNAENEVVKAWRIQGGASGFDRARKSLPSGRTGVHTTVAPQRRKAENNGKGICIAGRMGVHTTVTPANAGVQSSACDVSEMPWIPAFAGMTAWSIMARVSACETRTWRTHPASPRRTPGSSLLLAMCRKCPGFPLSREWRHGR